MDWLKLFKKQNQLTLITCGLLSTSGIIMQIYSLSGTKYDVVEYCFNPQKSKLSQIRDTLLLKGVDKSISQIQDYITDNFQSDIINDDIIQVTIDNLDLSSKNSKEERLLIRRAAKKALQKPKFCTNDKKYIAPLGFYEHEKYAPANPHFRREDIFVLSDKMTRLRTIPATNPHAKNYAAAGLFCEIVVTFLISQRAKRYKREFAAYFEQLKTDLNQEIKINEQKRSLLNHKTEVETEYIKDSIILRDFSQRYKDKPQELREFEQQQAQKHNEVVEFQRQIQLAKFKAEIAKFVAEEAKHRSESSRYLSAVVDPVELVSEIDYEALCPGKVGELEFYDWRDLADDAVGIIIAGNSGSGKTSVAVWVGGWLTKDEPAQVLALDPHANVNVLWSELNIHAISDFKLIEKQLLILLGLLDERRALSLEQLNLESSVIVFADEINACLENFEDKENMAIAIKRLGSEARKYKIALIALNQSSNVEDIGISAQMRNNYLLIGLNATARQLALQWKKDDPRRKHIEETAYSCVVRGSVPESIAVHPTHHAYKQFKKKGNKPFGLLPINQLPLTIELARLTDIKTDWHEDLIAWADELGRLPNPQEISLHWEEIMGHPPSSKQIELLHEYLGSRN